MDLGIAGKRALICASSKGLGRGCAHALADAGVNLVMNARGAEMLETSAQEIRDAYGVDVTTVAADISTADGQAAVLAAGGDVDILVNNAGGPPAGKWPDWEREDFIKALDSNMLAPIALIKALVPGMMDRGWGRVVNTTSHSVRAPVGILGLSTAARAGLTGYVAGTSRQVAGSGVTINNLLPGVHDTDRIKTLNGDSAIAQGISPQQARSNWEALIPAGRYGTPEEFGATCAFLCSQFSGFIVGQNIVLDGGESNITI